MKTASVCLLALSALAFAKPWADPHSDAAYEHAAVDASDRIEPLPEEFAAYYNGTSAADGSDLENRAVTQQLCDLTNYPTATEGPVKGGIRALRGKFSGNRYCTPPNACRLLTCSYGTGISICGGPTPYCNSGAHFGDEASNNYRSCWPRDPQCACGGSYTSNWGCCITRAMQRFYNGGAGHNILIKGGYGC